MSKAGLYARAREAMLAGDFPTNQYFWLFDSNHGNNTRVVIFHDGVAVLWFEKDYWDDIQAGRAPVVVTIGEHQRDITELILAIPEGGK